ncbi:MAG: hypothetical protein V7542_09610 [Limnobacter sp.]|uniref:hypothetical protein n=1 Tax=Limnobacter sp. TaxID=2003368 RepID=UPI00300304C1
MNAVSTSIEQQAKVTKINGSVQLIRDGFFLPAQAGMVLLPGDRVLSDAGGKAVIEFTGVKDALIIENGAAATFNLEVVEMDKAPQWIATDLYGQGVYFDGQQASEKTAGTADNPDLFGLFGTTNVNGESTGYPLLESLVFLGATAAIYSDNEDNSNTTETTSTTESGNNNSGTGDNNPPPAPEPNPDPEAEEPAASPLDAVLSPVTNALDDLLPTLGAPSPLGSLSVPVQASSNSLDLPS